jgi:MFS family permease
MEASARTKEKNAMNAETNSVTDDQASWTPLIVIISAQILMIFNVTTLQVSIDGIASSFNSPATMVGTAIVTYSLVVAGLIMVGARIAEIYGSRRVFRAMVVLFGAAMALMAFSPVGAVMIIAQATAGLAAAAAVPTLVVLLADNYRGNQQAKAVALLGAAQPMGIVLAFLIAGFLGTWIGWRFTFGLLALLAAGIYKFGAKLSPVKSKGRTNVDWIGAGLVASAIFLISIGCNNLTGWGVLLARPKAPFSVLDMSPAPIMIVCGVFLFQGFLVWSRKRQAAGKVPLISLEVLGTSQERAALFSLFAIGAITAAIAFLVPLYIQVVQGGSSLQTAVALIPLSVASVVAALLVVRLYKRVSPRRIARSAFLLAAIGVALLAAVIRNDWSNGMVIVSMIIIGIGEGALVALLFNVLISASPKEKAGDVGSLRGTANNLANAVGTAVASALIVSVLSSSVHRELTQSELLPGDLKKEINLDNVSFVSNDQLRGTLERTTATPEQVAEAVRLNTGARLLALKVSIFTLAGLALLAYFPAGALPGPVRIIEAPGRRESPGGESKQDMPEIGPELSPRPHPA